MGKWPINKQNSGGSKLKSGEGGVTYGANAKIKQYIDEYQHKNVLNESTQQLTEKAEC